MRYLPHGDRREADLSVEPLRACEPHRRVAAPRSRRDAGRPLPHRAGAEGKRDTATTSPSRSASRNGAENAISFATRSPEGFDTRAADDPAPGPAVLRPGDGAARHEQPARRGAAHLCGRRSAPGDPVGRDPARTGDAHPLRDPVRGHARLHADLIDPEPRERGRTPEQLFRLSRAAHRGRRRRGAEISRATGFSPSSATRATIRAARRNRR